MTPSPGAFEQDARVSMSQPSGLKTILRRFAHNASVILGGRLVFGLLNLASASLAWRAVGAEGLGVVILLQAYVRLVASLLRFQTWAAIVRFGPKALEDGEQEAVRRLFGFTIRLDVIGLGLALVLTALLAPVAARLLGWPPEAAALAPFFALCGPFIVPASMTGVLRLFDRFAVLARQHALNAVLRFAGVAAIFAFGGDLAALIVVWLSASILSGLYMMLVAVGELRRRNLLPTLRGRWSELTSGFDNIWRFVVILNGSSLIEAVISQVTILVVGGVLGPAAAGLLGVVRQITEALSKSGSVLGPIVFPEIALLASRNDRRMIRRLLSRLLIVCGACLAVFIGVLMISSEALLVALFDETAAAGAGLLVLVGAASSFVVLGFAMEPIMLSFGKDREFLALSVIVTAIYVGLLLLFIQEFGLIGVGYALLARQLLLFSSRMVFIHRLLRKV